MNPAVRGFVSSGLGVALAAVVAMPVVAQDPGTAGAGPVESTTTGATTRLRPPSMQFDPFRDAFAQRWGLAFVAGGFGENDVLNATDIGALRLLASNDSLLAWDFLDVLSIVPRGQGITGAAFSNAGMSLSAQLDRVTLSVSTVGRAYADFAIDNEVVSAIRGGESSLHDVSLGRSGGFGLGTSELGVHALVRLGSSGGGGPEVFLGLGTRFLRPVVYVQSSVAGSGGRIVVSGDSLVANVGVDVHSTSFDDIGDHLTQGTGGSGTALDFVVRTEWPRLALEAMVANRGTATVLGVERRGLNVDIAVASIDSLGTILDERRSGPFGDTLALVVRDTVSQEVRLPSHLRLAAAFSVSRRLQVNASLSTVGGSFSESGTTTVGGTFRPAAFLPIRAGLVFGRRQALGFTGGLGFETGHFLLDFQGATLGGFMSQARGVGGQFRLSAYF